MPEEAAESPGRELTPEEIEALLGKAGEVPAGDAESSASEDDASASTKTTPTPRAAAYEPAEAGLPSLAADEGGAVLVSPEGLLDFLGDVPLQISIELGRTNLTIGELVSLRRGAVVELDKLAGELVDVLANGMLIARGEVVVVNDYFSVRVTEIVSEEEEAG